MKTGIKVLLIAGFCCFADVALAAIHYVDMNNPTPAPPYTNWVTAATNIQTAVDLAVDGETVLVAEGHYLLSAEISVTNAITVQSVNGPNSTLVDGQGHVRCFNLGSFPVILSGLTITNGYTSEDGAGVYCENTTPIVTNCIIIGNNTGNIGTEGGGIYGGRAKNCWIIGNLANHGGGASKGITYNCVISGNAARYWGGGIRFHSAYNCTISANKASIGGGAFASEIYNCIVWGNSASHGSPDIGMGNGIALFTCSPDVVPGVDGNITNSPILVSTSHVAPHSPCREAGNGSYASGTDIDGEPWQATPSMGADEFNGLVTGALHCAIDCNEKVITGSPLQIRGAIDGAATTHVWSFGDGAFATNTIYPEHVWNTGGIYQLVLTAYNDSNLSSVSATQAIYVGSAESTTIYVAMEGLDSNDGGTWATAKASIQAGVDAQEYSGGLVLVSNGVYALDSEINVAKDITIHGVGGPRSTVVDGQASVRGFNLGTSACRLSGLTITNGYAVGAGSSGGGIYCIGSNAVISNCVIAGNRAGFEGGGLHSGQVFNSRILNNTAETTQYGGGGMVWGIAHNCAISGNTANQGGGIRASIANNCTIISNSAAYGGGVHQNISVANNCTIKGNTAINGGGAHSGTLNNCSIMGNSASDAGGGTHSSTLNNCTLIYNSASNQGGGAFKGTANNCIIWHNDAPLFPNINDMPVYYSCSPNVTHGLDGNITNAPQFIGAGEYRLASISPCVNTGSNGYVSVATDLDGCPRIVDGTVDMGAYEFGFDGRIITGCAQGGTGTIVQWTAFPMLEATVKCSTNLVSIPFTDLSAPLPYPVNSYTDTVSNGQCFYKVDLQP